MEINEMSVHIKKTKRRWGWVKVHLPALLYGWFWIGLATSGLFAPRERVLALESTLITEGWHLTALALCFGGITLGVYIWRLHSSQLEYGDE